MSEFESVFEIKDNQGTTVVFGGPGGISIGSVTTSETSVPASAGTIISGYQIQIIDKDDNDLLISFDSGTTFSFLEMKKNNFRSSDLKGEIKQLVIKSTAGSISDAKFEIILNREDY